MDNLFFRVVDIGTSFVVNQYHMLFPNPTSLKDQEANDTNIAKWRRIWERTTSDAYSFSAVDIAALITFAEKVPSSMFEQMVLQRCFDWIELSTSAPIVLSCWTSFWMTRSVLPDEHRALLWDLILHSWIQRNHVNDVTFIDKITDGAVDEWLKLPNKYLLFMNTRAICKGRTTYASNRLYQPPEDVVKQWISSSAIDAYFNCEAFGDDRYLYMEYAVNAYCQPSQSWWENIPSLASMPDNCLKTIYSAISATDFKLKLNNVAQLFMGCTSKQWKWYPSKFVPRAITGQSSATAWHIIENILFKRTENRQTGITFPVALYQDVLNHIMSILSNSNDNVVVRCCGELLSRIMDERSDDDLDFKQLRFIEMDKSIQTKIVKSTNTLFLGKLTVDKYQRFTGSQTHA